MADVLKESLALVVNTSLPDDRSLSEIGQQAIWSVTSAKPGNGVDMLRDNKEDTYWQSDGAQPHLINIQFQRKVVEATRRLQMCPQITKLTQKGYKI